MRNILFRLLGVSGIRFGGAAFNFALAIIAGRWLGVELSGAFFWYLGAVSVFSVFARLGLDKGYIKFGAIFDSSQGGALAAANYLIKEYGVVVLILSLTAVGGLFAYVQHFSPAVAEEGGGLVVALFSVSIFFVATVSILGSVAIGSGAVGVGTFAISFIPAFVTVLLIVLRVFPASASGFASAYLAGWACAFLYILVYLRSWSSKVSPVFGARFDELVRAWRDSVIPFGIIGGANVIEQWLPTIIAGAFFSSEDAAYFGVSSRIVGAIQILMVSASSAFSKQYADCAISELNQLVRNSVRSVVLVGGVILIAVYFFSKQLLSVFGSGFSEADGFLKMLLVGQVFNIFFGSYAVVLMMRGLVWGVAKIFAITSILYVSVSLIAALSGSANLLAFFAVCSVAIQSLGCFYLYKRAAA